MNLLCSKFYYFNISLKDVFSNSSQFVIICEELLTLFLILHNL